MLGIGISYWDAVSQRAIRMNGMDFDMELTEPRADQVELGKGYGIRKVCGSRCQMCHC